MARARKLKVFRTAVGFHDAYVATPSQKEALAAWGTKTNLFARGMAEVVTDSSLVDEPLSKPGMVIRRLREAAEEAAAALPKRPKPRVAGKPRAAARTRSKEAAPPPPRAKASKPPPPPRPRPSRERVDAAERELALMLERQEAERKALSAKEAEIARRRSAMGKSQDAERTRLERARDRAKAAYDAALRKWAR